MSTGRRAAVYDTAMGTLHVWSTKGNVPTDIAELIHPHANRVGHTVADNEPTARKQLAPISEHTQIAWLVTKCEVCGTWVAPGEDVIVRHDIADGVHRWRVVCGCDR